MAANPTISPSYPTDNSPIGTVGNAGGNYQGLAFQQLQIISILLREGLGLQSNDFECSTLVNPSVPTLITTT